MTRSTYLFLSILSFFVACALLAYVPLNNFLEKKYHSEILTRYEEAVEHQDKRDLAQCMASAQTYNAMLSGGSFLSGGEDYALLLNPGGDGIMGSLEIPSLHLNLPIFHGVEAGTLENGAGHLPGSSLPIGGESTHAVLSGHSGLAESRLFTDLHAMQLGDTFTLHILDQTLTYKVDQILTVLPQDTSALQIQPGEDLVTLLTCTPVGINTHRLLVRGRRVETPVSPVITEPSVQSHTDNTPDHTNAIAAGILLFFLPIYTLRVFWRKP